MKRGCLCLCGTNYTILNCVNAILTGSLHYDYYDLVVFLRTPDMKDIAEKTKATGLFRSVTCFSFINQLTTLQKVQLLLFPKHELKKYTAESIIPCTAPHDAILSQSVFYASVFSRLANTDNIYLLDEGLSSYTGRTISMEKRSLFSKVYTQLIGAGSNFIKAEYLNEVNLYMGATTNIQFYDIKKMNTTSYQICKRIFGCTYDPLYEKRYIYLGTLLQRLKNLLTHPEAVPGATETKAEELIRKFVDFVGAEMVHYRMHPMETVEEVERYGVTYTNGDNTWELLIHDLDIERKVLVSFFSSAALTPKLLYGYEPTLIFLYKLIGFEFYNADRVIESVKMIYQEPEKIIVPKSIEELKNILVMEESA